MSKKTENTENKSGLLLKCSCCGIIIFKPVTGWAATECPNCETELRHPDYEGASTEDLVSRIGALEFMLSEARAENKRLQKDLAWR
jgi:hypothetical protein